ncbi:J domain-containing protein, partial [Burkholderia sp. Bp9031]
MARRRDATINAIRLSSRRTMTTMYELLGVCENATN